MHDMPRATRHPTGQVSHLVGHEGAGSAIAALRRRGWATGLEAGVGASGVDCSRCGALFTVKVFRRSPPPPICARGRLVPADRTRPSFLVFQFSV